MRDRDPFFRVIVAVVAVIACWLLLMPVVPAIASATLHRFHLRTESFLWWCVQQPIPSMYNFANRAEVSEFPPGLVDPIIEESEKRYVNHFPSRRVTFADARAQDLSDGKDRWVHIDSAYRGQSLESRFHVKPLEGGGYELVRLSDEGQRP